MKFIDVIDTLERVKNKTKKFEIEIYNNNFRKILFYDLYDNVLSSFKFKIITMDFEYKNKIVFDIYWNYDGENKSLKLDWIKHNERISNTIKNGYIVYNEIKRCVKILNVNDEIDYKFFIEMFGKDYGFIIYNSLNNFISIYNL